MSWADEDLPAGPAYQTVEEFVRDFLAPTYRRALDTGAGVWCPEWWRDPEAVSRLTGLWRAWEKLHDDQGVGRAAWWRATTATRA